MNPLKRLGEQGQSVWLDYIRRSLLTGGDLQRMVDEDGLKGVTSNPAIFEKAIAGSTDYKAALRTLAADATLDRTALYERLAVEDIQTAAAVLKPVYETTAGGDGYVSLEVSPHLAHDTEKTCEEARRLWKAVGRPNVMIKVPGTAEGIPAVERLLGEGININVTLLFARETYEQVAGAYIRGLERFAAEGGELSRLAGVASFFVSRIDAAVDAQIKKRLAAAGSEKERGRLKGLLGKVAIANAKLAYRSYKDIFSGKRWEALAAKGARTQRVLWASTGTKNPSYPDTYYVEELIGADTVNTIPPATYEAFRDHGRLRPSLEEDLAGARRTLAVLEEGGISLSAVTDKLLADGLRLFSEAFEQLLCAVEGARLAATRGEEAHARFSLPGTLDTEVRTQIATWQTAGQTRKAWARNASIWTGADEGKWLGWLGVTEELPSRLEEYAEFAAEVRAEKFSHAVVLGMGGSSLCPEVLGMTFGKQDGHPELHVLDSTDPAQVAAVEAKVDLARTLFIVSSKSGSTLEPNIFSDYFFDRVERVVGAGEAGRHFVAITDPGSKLQAAADARGFRRVFLGEPSIGGRYSALSPFGVVPAAVMGLDVARLLDRADEMVQACAGCVPTEDNPGASLGAVLGVLGRSGRDKLTLVTSPGIGDLGAWLEQLVAESTGKQGKGLIPVDGERLGPPEVYGEDRLFVYLRLDPEPDPEQDTAVERLEKAGQPVVRISVADRYDLGQELFRWEFATAMASSAMGINPFDQPDVEASKIATRKLTDEYEARGSLPAETPVAEEDGLRLFTDEANDTALAQAAGGRSVAGYLKAHLDRLQTGDYFALLAYVEMNARHREELQALRHAIRDARRTATCLGFGPRFLHSTGQAYKGGPNTGVFLQITCDDAADLPVPGRKFTFGAVKAAQARGDFAVLAERTRRVLRVHLGADVAEGLRALRERVTRALAG